MATKLKAVKAPSHLTKESAEWWEQVYRKYELQPHHQKILTAACESWDRMVQARKGIEVNGLCFVNRHGDRKPSPEVAIERDSRIAFARLVRELAIDGDAPSDSRPPTISGRYK